MNLQKQIIFDIDGTLIDTKKAAIDSLRMALIEVFGNKYKYENLDFAFGIPFNMIMSELNIENFNAIQRSYIQHLKNEYMKTKYFTGIEDILKNLAAKNVVTGIVTSRTNEEIIMDPCLQKIKKYIQHIITADDTIKHKPDADPLLKFAELSGANITNCVYIGDTYYDYICAKNAGMKFALALWGAKDIIKIEADYNLLEPKNILDIL